MKPKQLYTISFIEGGVVMVTEIAGAKILTPFFGASVYSWASTLSITLLALMAGYYSGGYATTKARLSTPDKIVWVFFVSGLSVALMPSLGHFIMERTIGFPFFAGLIVSQLLFLFLPIFLMGTISPMIIFQITKKAEQSGRSAGNIYAISTCGGILFTLVFGFVIIPYYGISLPLRLLGLLVALFGLVTLIRMRRKDTKGTVAIIVFILVSILASGKSKEGYLLPENIRLLDYSEGLLGELKVIDEHTKRPDGTPVTVRKLRTNNIQQNYVFSQMPQQSLMYYVNFTNQLLRFLPQKESALLVGLGAGSLYAVLQKNYGQVETVEIDQRIYDIGVKYFGMPDHKEHAITDGRYFINTCQKKYDLVILDVIIGESVPAQLITLESFKRCRELLKPGGSLLIEHGGVMNFDQNSFVPSIAKTLEAAGFQVRLFNPLISDKHGDVLLLATDRTFETKDLNVQADVLIKQGPLTMYELPLSAFKGSEARVLTDDNNNVDAVLKAHYMNIRSAVRREMAKARYVRHS